MLFNEIFQNQIKFKFGLAISVKDNMDLLELEMRARAIKSFLQSTEKVSLNCKFELIKEKPLEDKKLEMGC
jgi:hypothetical protein